MTGSAAEGDGQRHTALLSLGSNLGDRAASLSAAVALMEARGILVTRTSSVWETAPVPGDQPAFLNAAVEVETALSPRALLTALKQIEHDLGRRPGRRWGPRVIDLDILFYDDLSLEAPDLTIPHPEARDRRFVLVPLAEIWPGSLPVLGQTALELLAAASPLEMHRTSHRLRP